MTKSFLNLELCSQISFLICRIIVVSSTKVFRHFWKSSAWTKLEPLWKKKSSITFEYNAMYFVIQEQFYQFQLLFSGVVPPTYRKCVQKLPHIDDIYLYIIKILLISHPTDSLQILCCNSQNVPKITNLVHR